MPAKPRRSRTRPPLDSATARKRAEDLGITPLSAVEFSKLLGQFESYITKTRSDALAGRIDWPKPKMPDPVWVIGGNSRLVWPRSVCLAYKKAKDAKVETFKARIPAVPPELAPITAFEVAQVCGVKRDTVAQWKARGKLPEPTWTIGTVPEDLWARGVIEDWWRAEQLKKVGQATGDSARNRVAREFVRVLQAEGALSIDEDAGTVTVHGVTFPMDELDLVALASI